MKKFLSLSALMSVGVVGAMGASFDLSDGNKTLTITSGAANSSNRHDFNSTTSSISTLLVNGSSSAVTATVAASSENAVSGLKELNVTGSASSLSSLTLNGSISLSDDLKLNLLNNATLNVSTLADKDINGDINATGTSASATTATISGFDSISGSVYAKNTTLKLSGGEFTSEPVQLESATLDLSSITFPSISFSDLNTSGTSTIKGLLNSAVTNTSNEEATKIVYMENAIDGTLVIETANNGKGTEISFESLVAGASNKAEINASGNKLTVSGLKNNGAGNDFTFISSSEINIDSVGTLSKNNSTFKSNSFRADNLNITESNVSVNASDRATFDGTLTLGTDANLTVDAGSAIFNDITSNGSIIDVTAGSIVAENFTAGETAENNFSFKARTDDGEGSATFESISLSKVTEGAFDVDSLLAKKFEATGESNFTIKANDVVTESFKVDGAQLLDFNASGNAQLGTVTFDNEANGTFWDSTINAESVTINNKSEVNFTNSVLSTEVEGEFGKFEVKGVSDVNFTFTQNDPSKVVKLGAVTVEDSNLSLHGGYYTFNSFNSTGDSNNTFKDIRSLTVTGDFKSESNVTIDSIVGTINLGKVELDSNLTVLAKDFSTTSLTLGTNSAKGPIKADINVTGEANLGAVTLKDANFTLAEGSGVYKTASFKTTGETNVTIIGVNTFENSGEFSVAGMKNLEINATDTIGLGEATFSDANATFVAGANKTSKDGTFKVNGLTISKDVNFSVYAGTFINEGNFSITKSKIGELNITNGDLQLAGKGVTRFDETNATKINVLDGEFKTSGLFVTKDSNVTVKSKGFTNTGTLDVNTSRYTNKIVGNSDVKLGGLVKVNESNFTIEGDARDITLGGLEVDKESNVTLNGRNLTNSGKFVVGNAAGNNDVIINASGDIQLSGAGGAEINASALNVGSATAVARSLTINGDLKSYGDSNVSIFAKVFNVTGDTNITGTGNSEFNITASGGTTFGGDLLVDDTNLTITSGSNGKTSITGNLLVSNDANVTITSKGLSAKDVNVTGKGNSKVELEMKSGAVDIDRLIIGDANFTLNKAGKMNVKGVFVSGDIDSNITLGVSGFVNSGEFNISNAGFFNMDAGGQGVTLFAKNSYGEVSDSNLTIKKAGAVDLTGGMLTVKKESNVTFSNVLNFNAKDINLTGTSTFTVENSGIDTTNVKIDNLLAKESNATFGKSTINSLVSFEAARILTEKDSNITIYSRDFKVTDLNVSGTKFDLFASTNNEIGKLTAKESNVTLDTAGAATTIANGLTAEKESNISIKTASLEVTGGVDLNESTFKLLGTNSATIDSLKVFESNATFEGAKGVTVTKAELLKDGNISVLNGGNLTITTLDATKGTGFALKTDVGAENSVVNVTTLELNNTLNLDGDGVFNIDSLVFKNKASETAELNRTAAGKSINLNSITIDEVNATAKVSTNAGKITSKEALNVKAASGSVLELNASVLSQLNYNVNNVINAIEGDRFNSVKVLATTQAEQLRLGDFNVYGNGAEINASFVRNEGTLTLHNGGNLLVDGNFTNAGNIFTTISVDAKENVLDSSAGSLYVDLRDKAFKDVNRTEVLTANWEDNSTAYELRATWKSVDNRALKSEVDDGHDSNATDGVIDHMKLVATNLNGAILVSDKTTLNADSNITVDFTGTVDSSTEKYVVLYSKNGIEVGDDTNKTKKEYLKDRVNIKTQDLGMFLGLEKEMTANSLAFRVFKIDQTADDVVNRLANNGVSDTSYLREFLTAVYNITNNVEIDSRILKFGGELEYDVLRNIGQNGNQQAAIDNFNDTIDGLAFGKGQDLIRQEIDTQSALSIQNRFASMSSPYAKKAEFARVLKALNGAQLADISDNILALAHYGDLSLQNRLYANIIGAYGKGNSDFRASSSLYGINVGYDTRSGNDIMGAYLSWTNGRFSSDNQRNDSTNFTLGAYTRLVFGESTELDVTIDGSYSKVDEKISSAIFKNSLRNDSDYNMFGIKAQASVGYLFGFDSFVLKPFAGVVGQFISVGEKDGDRFKVDARNTSNINGRLGVDLRNYFEDGSFIYLTPYYEQVLAQSVGNARVSIADSSSSMLFSEITGKKAKYLTVLAGGEMPLADDLRVNVGLGYKKNLNIDGYSIIGNLGLKYRF